MRPQLSKKEKRAIYTQLYCSCAAARAAMSCAWNDFYKDVQRMYDSLVNTLESKIGFDEDELPRKEPQPEQIQQTASKTFYETNLL